MCTTELQSSILIIINNAMKMVGPGTGKNEICVTDKRLELNLKLSSTKAKINGIATVYVDEVPEMNISVEHIRSSGERKVKINTYELSDDEARSLRYSYSDRHLVTDLASYVGYEMRTLDDIIKAISKETTQDLRVIPSSRGVFSIEVKCKKFEMYSVKLGVGSNGGVMVSTKVDHLFGDLVRSNGIVNDPDKFTALLIELISEADLEIAECDKIKETISVKLMETVEAIYDQVFEDILEDRAVSEKLTERSKEVFRERTADILTTKQTAWFIKLLLST